VQWGGEEIVEAEGEGGGPETDEYCFEKGVEELCGGAPEAYWPAKVFKLCLGCQYDVLLEGKGQT
jgi:hypothetical protein